MMHGLFHDIELSKINKLFKNFNNIWKKMFNKKIIIEGMSCLCYQNAKRLI